MIVPSPTPSLFFVCLFAGLTWPRQLLGFLKQSLGLCLRLLSWQKTRRRLIKYGRLNIHKFRSVFLKLFFNTWIVSSVNPGFQYLNSLQYINADQHFFSIWKAMEMSCHICSHWANAIIVHACAPGSYKGCAQRQEWELVPWKDLVCLLLTIGHNFTSGLL